MKCAKFNDQSFPYLSIEPPNVTGYGVAEQKPDDGSWV
jgi:hypothetical protein